ncbi:MAG TPA: SRPBCC family protein [Amycolatopsis sp.]|uniref:SRPBCC family protein n=1 Tax=Amycolatopsis sp. TaxID=37632 RepID=UPI002B4991DD|nr:SRPBCC family protein [Amycolatopsis sp.]HKS43985.1 SRPBCC family protein [Amycolatopsis sp.]
MDIVGQINSVHRAVRSVGETNSVLLRRTYEAEVEDLWDACTEPDRISRWLTPVTGDFRLGGTYQLKGNAGGKILRCEPPRLLRVSWVFGDMPPSEVEARITPAGDGKAQLELEHGALADDDHWDSYGPGAVGIGWDLSLLGLGLHLRGEHLEDPQAWMVTAEAKQFMTRSSQDWGSAYEASGASPERAAAVTERTTAAYLGG